MPNLFLVLLGGAIGAGFRYHLSRVALEQMGAAFPWGTWIANLLGGLLMGLLAGIALRDGPVDDPLLRAEIAAFDVDSLAFSAMSERFIDQLKAGEAHPAMPSMMKYAGTELNKRRHELIMAAGGSDALEWDSERSKGGKAARDWLRTKANSIEGGTSEIQLGIVAKHILRLPGA